jgi:hypothetical protein
MIAGDLCNCLVRYTMRKIRLILPACAVLLAAAVLTSELGAALTESTPDTTAAAAYDDQYVGDDGDISAANWIEAGKKNPDTRKHRLPHPKTVVKKKPKQ